MRWIICILSVALAGCPGLITRDRGENDSHFIMPLWNRYQQCLATTEPAALLQIVDQIEQVTLRGPEPPSWLKSWGDHVMRQPLRTAVDPLALGAACTIQAAKVLAKQHRVPEARAFYRRVIDRYPQREWTYYHERAKQALTLLPNNEPAIMAHRSSLPSLPTP